ncbi:MAG: ComEC/Rec2 family competence protein [Bacteroidales bacterium]|nr:ComEC/Rec2 family competence protein [Bacteroidales bacterium]
MNSWRPFPLIRLAIPFVSGIIAEGYIGAVTDKTWWFDALLVFLFLVMLILPVVMRSYRFRWITGLVVNCFLLMAGYEIAYNQRPENDPDFLGKSPDGLFIATLAEPPVTHTSWIKVILEVRFRHENGKWVRSSGNAVGYLKFKPGVQSLYYGDPLLLRAGFSEISDNSNPDSFNYSRYLKNKGISHRVFAESYSWRVIGIKPWGVVRKLAFQVRDRLLNILRENHVEGREFAVAAALLLGYVDELDADLRNDYAAAGAMHILSVSGMHVGIIYIFLEFLLGFLNKSKPGRLIKALLLLILIWFYAMITGLSPCVLRAAAMLSLPILGKSLKRSPNIFNIIAASVVLILAMDPLLILDVGFQLSYLAVTGIVVLFKPIYDMYVTSIWFPDKIWSIVAVSIAAQIATLPISLFAFHQFPNYFILTNIFVVPLSSIIIYSGILVLVVGGIPAVCLLGAKVLIFLIWLLNSILHFIEQLPYSTIRGVYISAPEMILLYVIIVSFFLFLTRRKITFLNLSLIAVIVLFMNVLNFQVQRLRSSRMTIFNANREALYMFSSQDKAIVLYTGTTRNSPVFKGRNHDMVNAVMCANGIQYRRDYWLQSQDRPYEIAKSYVPVMKSGNYIQFSGCRIALLSSSIPRGLKKSLEVDLVIITGNPKIIIDDVVKTYHPGHIIIDATNSRFKTRKWLREADGSGVVCHAVTEHGAFQKEF